MKRFPLLLAAVVFVLGGGFVSGSEVSGAKITGYGVFSEKHEGTRAAPKTAAGVINKAVSPRLLKATDTVMARRGTTFGITYTVSGSPVNERVPLVVRVFHPRMYNPETRETLRMGEYRATAAIGGPNYDAYTFDHDWELVPGKWTFQVSHGGEVLVEKTFNVRTAR